MRKHYTPYTYGLVSIFISVFILFCAVVIFTPNAKASDNYNYLGYSAVPKTIKPTVKSHTTQSSASANNIQKTPQEKPVVSNPANNIEASITADVPVYIIIPVKSVNSAMNAYGDLVDLISNDFAIKLAALSKNQHLPYTILQPGEVQHLVPTIGLSGVYQQLIQDYRQSGRPDSSRVQFFVDKYSETGRKISGLIFMEANFDPFGGTSLNKKIKSPLLRIFDINSIFNMPEALDVTYEVTAKATLFDITDNDIALVWQTQSMTKMPLGSIGNFQSSVYATDNALTRFAPTSEILNKKMLLTFPGVNTTQDKQTLAEQSKQTLHQVFGRVLDWTQGQ